jgi:hypothetical protein
MTHSSIHPHRPWRWFASLALYAGLTAVPLSAQAAPGAASAPGTAAAPAGASPASISVALSGKVAGNLASQYMGLSFESSTLNSGYRYDNVGNLPQLLKNLGTGVIRFGGSSADTDFSGVTQKEASAVARLAKATGWKVLYTEGLQHFNAARVKADARLVGKTLGARADISWNPAVLSAFASKDKKTASALSAHYYPLGCARAGETRPPPPAPCCQRLRPARTRHG